MSGLFPVCCCFKCGADLTQTGNISCRCYTTRLEKENRYLRARVKKYEDQLGITPQRNIAKAKQLLGLKQEQQKRKDDQRRNNRRQR